MKKIMIAILSILLPVVMFGCGENNKNDDTYTFQDLTFQVPNDWSVNKSDSDNVDLTWDNDSVVNISISNITFSKELSLIRIDNQVTENMGYEVIETKENIGGAPTDKYVFTNTHTTKVYINCNENNVYLITFYTAGADGADKDFESLLKSIKINENVIQDITATTEALTKEDSPKPNTSEMVEYIAREAKKSANSPSNEKDKEAICYIRDNYPNYFDSNAKMENMMKYGYYLEYAYSKNGPTNIYANLGMDAYQVVKYVYRNTENVESDHVQENLRQIEEALGELPPEYR